MFIITSCSNNNRTLSYNIEVYCEFSKTIALIAGYSKISGRVERGRHLLLFGFEFAKPTAAGQGFEGVVRCFRHAKAKSSLEAQRPLARSSSQHQVYKMGSAAGDSR